MILAQFTLEDCEGAAVKRRSLWVALLRFAKDSEIVEGHRDIRMVRAEQLLFDRERASIAQLRFFNVAAGIVESCEVIQVNSYVIILCTVNTLEDSESAQVELFRLLIFALPIEERRESGHIGCCIRVVRA
ncbi:MAG TPA: hypothetical protein VIF64_12585 [Pyrinomonadaceae bacterium]